MSIQPSSPTDFSEGQIRLAVVPAHVALPEGTNIRSTNGLGIGLKLIAFFSCLICASEGICQEPLRNVNRRMGHGLGRPYHVYSPAYDSSYYNPWSSINTPSFGHQAGFTWQGLPMNGGGLPNYHPSPTFAPRPSENKPNQLEDLPQPRRGNGENQDNDNSTVLHEFSRYQAPTQPASGRHPRW
ncbi:MAG TPA: hypothetical protein PKD64_02195 [Pirellulaceae bacterium]|nr:hypothetical protein [Pirellulaceae bacterium]HMO90980.1 hypothetical protein [Pirellulaceae bacterium]HMP68095.1 hypothetical protein [Pirellulaceae bacterium]